MSNGSDCPSCRSDTVEERIANLMALGMSREMAEAAIREGDRNQTMFSSSRSNPSASSACVSCGARPGRFVRLYRSPGGMLCGPCYGDWKHHQRNGMEGDFWG